jgi:hypothetical protein
MWLFIGLAMFAAGLVWIIMDSGHGADPHGVASAHGAHGGGHAAPGWKARLSAVLWHNSIFFTGISLIGVFFIAVQYVAWAGWSVSIKRIPEAFGSFLPFTFVAMVLTFLFGGHEIFHWTHADVVAHDEILQGKSGFLNTPFFLARMVIFFGLWYFIWTILRKYSNCYSCLLMDQVNGYRRAA